MRTGKHIVRAIVLGFVAATLAFAHPTDVGVGSPNDLSEMRQEKLAFVRFRIARATAEPVTVPAFTLAADEARRESLPDAAHGIVEACAALVDAVLAD